MSKFDTLSSDFTDAYDSFEEFANQETLSRSFVKSDQSDGEVVASKVTSDSNQSTESKNVNLKTKKRANGLTFMLIGSGIGGALFLSTPISSNSSSPQFVKDPATKVSVALSQAESWYSNTGSFTGFKPTVDVLYAAGGPFFIAAYSDKESCYYVGVVPNRKVEIKEDPTGQRCDATKVAELANLLKS